MAIQAILYWLSIIGIITVGVFVLNMQKKREFIPFGLFALVLASWLVCQFFIDRGSNLLFWLALGFLALELAVSTFFVFAYLFPEKDYIPRRVLLIATMPVVVFGPISFSPLLIKSVTSSDNIVFGPLYTAQTVTIIIYALLGLFMLLKKFYSVSRYEKNQLILLTLAFVPFLAASFVSGILFADNQNLQFLRPLSALATVAIIAYAIVRRGLFDIRGFAVRATAYALTVIFLGLLYVAPVVYGVAYLLGGIDIMSWEFLGAVVASTFAATNYQRLRNWFNRVTNRIFFRDAYEPTEMMADLNKSLVGVIDIQRLLSVSAEVVESNIKPEFCYFVLRTPNSDRENYRLVGGKQKRISEAATVKLLPLLETKLHANNTYTDLLDSKSALRKEFVDQDIAAVLRLLPTGSRKDEALGYMVVGVRRSGKAYDQTDAQVLEAVASTLIIAIQNALNFEEIQQFNVTLQQKVDEATRKYRAANERLKQLDETKDEFISMASHQLRTPLTSVKGYLSMVLDGDVGKISKGQEELLKQSFLSSQRMVSLIADLLNLSRLNTGKFVIDAAPVDLRDVINSEIMQLKETAKAKSIDLRYENPADFPTLMLDETKIHQVVMNFIDNAIYYTPAGGEVEVSLLQTPQHVEFRVKDNGIGVPRDQQKHLFTKFYRAENAKRARPDGTGLGIFMAKKVVVAQNGAVIFESEEGKGSTFGFRFNKNADAPTSKSS